MPGCSWRVFPLHVPVRARISPTGLYTTKHTGTGPRATSLGRIGLTPAVSGRGASSASSRSPALRQLDEGSFSRGRARKRHRLRRRVASDETAWTSGHVLIQRPPKRVDLAMTANTHLAQATDIPLVSRSGIIDDRLKALGAARVKASRLISSGRLPSGLLNRPPRLLALTESLSRRLERGRNQWTVLLCELYALL